MGKIITEWSIYDSKFRITSSKYSIERAENLKLPWFLFKRHLIKEIWKGIMSSVDTGLDSPA